MDTSFGGFSATQGTVERKTNVRSRGQAVLPVTISDIQSLLPGQDAVRIGSHESCEVALVGIVRSAQFQPSSVYNEYRIDDGTGAPLLVRQTIEGERNGSSIPLMENTYVRVFGRIRTLGNDRTVVAYVMYPVEDLNELTMHLLEVVHCKLFYSKNVLRQHEEQEREKMGNSNSMYATSGGGASKPTTYSSLSKPASDAHFTAGLSGVNAEIYSYLSSSTTDTGFSFNEIQKRFPQMPNQKLRDVLEGLSSEGHVYTTIDDDHYKTTDS